MGIWARARAGVGAGIPVQGADGRGRGQFHFVKNGGNSLGNEFYLSCFMGVWAPTLRQGGSAEYAASHPLWGRIPAPGSLSRGRAVGAEAR